jgi:hypothetical protein
MILKGSEIVDIRYNTSHIVDDIEVINGKKLVFTEDIKCIPYTHCKLVDRSYNTSIYFAKNTIYDLINSEREIYLGVLSPPQFIPSVKKKKNVFLRVWNKIKLYFTYPG